MAVTVNILHRGRRGRRHYVVADITFDSSHAAGGEDLTPNMLGFGSKVDIMRCAADVGGYVIQYDYANEKITAYRSAGALGPMDEADTIDLSSVTARCEFEGY